MFNFVTLCHHGSKAKNTNYRKHSWEVWTVDSLREMWTAEKQIASWESSNLKPGKPEVSNKILQQRVYQICSLPMTWALKVLFSTKKACSTFCTIAPKQFDLILKNW